MDKLNIRVAEWQTTEGTIRDWSVLTGIYTIGPSGSISLPFLGDLAAEGKTTETIAEEIGVGLEQQFGLKDRPSASVELSAFRPIYVSGDVDRSGEYPFTPKLTVAKAISLAGGLRRFTGTDRDFIGTKGDANVYITQKGRLVARRARLEAESAHKDTIEIPPDIKNYPDANALMASETALMDSRRKRMTLQLQSLDDLKSLLQAEIASLAKKSESQTRQLELARQDLGVVEVLAEKGLALSARKMASEERATEIEGTLLDIDTSTLRAKQDISKANQDQITLRNDFDAQVAEELRTTQADIDVLDLRIKTSKALLSDAVGSDGVDASANISYSITRELDGQSKDIPAKEDSFLQPGDLVKVKSEILVQ